MDLHTVYNCMQTLSEENCQSLGSKMGIDFKPHEFITLKNMLSKLFKIEEWINLDGFHLSYKIPNGINEEFDLLRIGEKSAINIELKSKATEEKIFKQLCRKAHYLKFTCRKIKCISFEESTGSFYQLSDEYTLEKITAFDLIELIDNQTFDVLSTTEMEKIFKPADFLVSPFNDTAKFIDNEYFLTPQQNNIKNLVNKNNLETICPALIEGNAGTGKTLLLYDLIRTFLSDDKKVLTIHCGKLNDGHSILNSEYSWSVVPIKDSIDHLSEDLDIIVIDEAQRIWQNQLEEILTFADENDILCIFSMDENQVLHKNEIQSRSVEVIRKLVDKKSSHKLTGKIRTNKELADFTKLLFSRKHFDELQTIPNAEGNIRTKFFCRNQDALNFCKSLDESKWKVLGYTTSQKFHDPLEKITNWRFSTPHEVIGQEFDSVAILLDNNFFFETDKKGTTKLSGTDKSYYHAVKMLFQNVTRTKSRLCLVVADNFKLYEGIISILDNVY